MDNLREFNLAVDRAVVQMTEGKLVLLHRWLALEALRRVVFRTPVDTGRTRGAWQATNDAPATGVGPGSLDRNGSGTIRKGQASIAGIRPFSAWWLSNNVEWISVLEDGGFVPANPGKSSDPRLDRLGRVLVRNGFSLQAPQGMVGPTIDELQRLFDKAT